MTYRGKLRKQIMVVGTVIGAVVAALATPAQAAPSESSDSVPGFNGTVLAVAYSGSTIFLGGTFTSALVNGKTVARNRLAAVNAYTGELLPWAPSADGRVKALAVSGSSVYVGGDFLYVSGQKRDSLARIDVTTGAVSSTFKHAIEGRPYALAAANGRLYVGGTLTKVNGLTRTRLAAFDLSSGVLDSAWKPTTDDQVEALATAGGRVYVGGKFHQVNGTSGYDRLVALDPYSAAIVTGFKPRPAVIVFAVTATSDGVYTAHGGQGGTAAAYTLTGTKRWSATFDGDAQAVTTLGDTVYVGGHFDHACRTARTGDQGVCLDGADDRVKLAGLAMNDGHLRDWTANMNGIEGVLTLASNPSLGAIAAGGAFTTINGVTQKRFAQFS
ncbi:NHL repeat-containing protein [Couchioplanes azureus]|uniref:PQQ-binding-like beta-propeller repeat protein n=1 Tax=Couchioplanes caeruleus TaxID=56438 RepID=UPI0019C54601|nr:PQQ-binding-like beta-propeller repeat protein [Couchioplanes caeruleus]GGQ44171.1 hypothetical protein GCM10010166_10850 [Couchioplanes caeruleus subsp. azureus]